MKKNLLYLFMLVCSLGAFTSCSDDDDDNKGGEEAQLSQQLAGTYYGDLNVSIDEINLDEFKQQIYVTDNGNNTVTLELKDFSIKLAEGSDPLTVGDIVIPSVTLKEVDGTVQLSETQTTLEHETLGNLQITVTGTSKSGNLNLNITVFASTLNQNIKVAFDGEKINSEPKDFAAEVAGYYSREDLELTGIDVDASYLEKLKGISIIRAGFNKVGIESTTFYFVNNKGKSLVISSMDIQKTDNGIELLETTAVSKYDKNVTFVVSGNIVDNKLTLNVKMSDGTNEGTYVFTGSYKNADASMSKMTINSDVVTVQPEISDVSSNKANITFYVKDGTTDEQLSLVPEFEIPAGATIYYGTEPYVKGTAIDFSTEQQFKVTAESGVKSVTYTVTSEVLPNFTFATNFDNDWVHTVLTEKISYDEPGEGWSTSNGGVAYIKMMDLYPPEDVDAVTQDASQSRKPACLQTLDTKGMSFGFTAIPKVTSGSVYTGSFEVNMSNTLKSTKFGYPCYKKPVAFTGTYKYAAGPIYYVCPDPDPTKANVVTEDATKKDLPAMNAVLYEVNSYAYDFLDGTNLLTADNVVAIASVDGKEQADYTDFNVNFVYKDGKSFDSTKKYKLAIVCSSSKDGDKFSGAPGSVLYVDDLAVTF